MIQNINFQFFAYFSAYIFWSFFDAGLRRNYELRLRIKAFFELRITKIKIMKKYY